jgi:hypothetical protein
MEILGDGKRGKEWAEREQRYQTAEAVSDVMEPYRDSVAVPFDEAAKMVANALVRKARRYGPVNCAVLDALGQRFLGSNHIRRPV